MSFKLCISCCHNWVCFMFWNSWNKISCLLSAIQVHVEHFGLFTDWNICQKNETSYTMKWVEGKAPLGLYLLWKSLSCWIKCLSVSPQNNQSLCFIWCLIHYMVFAVLLLFSFDRSFKVQELRNLIFLDLLAYKRSLYYWKISCKSLKTPLR